MATSADRRMTMVAFLQAQNCSNYPASWRHAATAQDFLTADYYQRIARAIGKETGPDTPLAQARKAGLELLTSLIADKLGGTIASEGLARHFAGELGHAPSRPVTADLLGVDDQGSPRDGAVPEPLTTPPGYEDNWFDLGSRQRVSA